MASCAQPSLLVAPPPPPCLLRSGRRYINTLIHLSSSLPSNIMITITWMLGWGEGAHTRAPVVAESDGEKERDRERQRERGKGKKINKNKPHKSERAAASAAPPAPRCVTVRAASPVVPVDARWVRHLQPPAFSHLQRVNICSFSPLLFFFLCVIRASGNGEAEREREKKRKKENPAAFYGKLNGNPPPPPPPPPPMSSSSCLAWCEGGKMFIMSSCRRDLRKKKKRRKKIDPGSSWGSRVAVR